MRKYFYDLHIHSCLSPCGDNDMTVNNIAGMGKLAGLDIMALTDHNSVKNLPAFFKACENYGVIPIGGMELTTAEDIHMVCLFPTLETALDFGNEVEKRRVKIKNKAEIFGEQRILNEKDEIIGFEENLLINATTISLEEGFLIAKSFGGTAYPAHIDRDSNGIIAALGTFPETPDFTAAEIYNKENYKNLLDTFEILKSKKIIFCSDAHYLDKIPDKSNYFEFEDNANDDEIRLKIIELLNEKVNI
ncbi:MAG: PHP domain-containing protein [Acutalibacteraceae bacterium]